MVKKLSNYIEFNNLSCYHLIAIAVPICCMLTTYVQKSELNTINKEILSCKESNCVKVFPYFFNIFVSKILSIFLVLIKRHMNKERSSNKLQKIETKQMRRYHLGVNNLNKKIKVAFLIIGISFLELFFKIEGYLTIGKPNFIELKLGFLLLVPIISVFILKKQLFKHHYLAFGICLVAFILVCISTVFYKKKPTALEQLRHLSFSIPLGLAFVLIKYLYNNSFVDAFSFLFYDGILCIGIPFIAIAIIAIFKGSDYFSDNMNGVSNIFDQRVFLIFFLVVIFSFFYYLTNALTIYFFNPSLMVMTDILSPIFRWVFEVKKEIDEDNFLFIAIFKITGFLLIIFTAFVFNELLILHFCGFDCNIEENIKERAESEAMGIGENCSFSITRDGMQNISNLSTGENFEFEMGET